MILFGAAKKDAELFVEGTLWQSSFIHSQRQ